MNNLIHKLRSTTGESLLESLVAILVFTLSSIVLYTMVTASAEINTVAKEADQESQVQMIIAEQGEVSGQDGSVSMTLTQTATDTVNLSMGTVDVIVYGGEGDALYAYYADDSTNVGG